MKKEFVFMSPYSGDGRKLYTYWAMKKHHKLICDQIFTRGAILEFVEVIGNSICVKLREDLDKKSEIFMHDGNTFLGPYGYFISLDSIDPDSDYTTLVGEDNLLFFDTVNDEKNQVGVLFCMLSEGDSLEFSINKDENIVVNFRSGRIIVRIVPVNVKDTGWTVLYSKLNKARKTVTFYDELSNIRGLIKESGWSKFFETLTVHVSPDLKKDLILHKDSLSKLGIELQSRISLLSLGLSKLEV